MNDKSEEESVGLWGLIKSFFSNIGLKAKLVIGAIVGVFSFIIFHLLRSRMNDKAILELELKKVKEEIEIEKAQEEIDLNNVKLKSLEERAVEIKKEIKELEEKEEKRKVEALEEEVSHEELDKFFDDRGF